MLSQAHKEWIAHPGRDSYWDAIKVDRRYAAVDIPVLHWGGWYDVFLEGTIDGWKPPDGSPSAVHSS